MDIRATVLIPTHDHGPTLLRAARTALTQTVQEIELFIIGDGISAGGREAVEQLQQADTRVRFFDFPKGPRNGERYRHEVLLNHARGPIVCYLSDDDLWLAHHVETMERLLADADFAHTLSVKVEPDGGLDAGNDLDFRIPGLREEMMAGHLGGTGLSCMAHTMAFYRRMPVGWDTTPAGVATDTHMARKIVAHPDCRAISGTRPTLLRFASTRRRGWSAEQRAGEIDVWAERITNPAWLARFQDDVRDALVQADAGKRFKLDRERRKRKKHMARIGELKDHVDQLTRAIASLRAEVTALAAERDRAIVEGRAAADEFARALKRKTAEDARKGTQLDRKTAECERLRAAQALLQAQAEEAAAAHKQRVRELSRRASDYDRLLAERDALAGECRRLTTTAKRLKARLVRAEKGRRPASDKSPP